MSEDVGIGSADKRALYRYDNCPDCNGSGKIRGAKVVQLTQWDRQTWRERERKDTKKLVTILFATWVFASVFFLHIRHSLLLEWSPRFLLVLFPLMIGLFFAFSVGGLSWVLLGKKQNKFKLQTLRHYGVEKGERWTLEGEEEGD